MAVRPATFGVGFQAPGQKPRQRTPFLFVDRRPKTNSRTRELHCLREDHRTLFDGIRQEIPEHNPTNKTCKVFRCTKPNLAQTKTFLDPTKRTVLSNTKPVRLTTTSTLHALQKPLTMFLSINPTVNIQTCRQFTTTVPYKV